MQEELPCQVVCRIVLDAKSAKWLESGQTGWNVTQSVFQCIKPAKLYYPQNKDELYFLNNHLSFRVIYHKNPDNNSARIVGFEVTPHRFILSSLLFMEENQEIVTRVDLGYVLSNGSNM
ncbi:putative nonaspanin (TM9SF) [Helianthus anomalus]